MKSAVSKMSVGEVGQWVKFLVHKPVVPSLIPITHTAKVFIKFAEKLETPRIHEVNPKYQKRVESVTRQT